MGDGALIEIREGSTELSVERSVGDGITLVIDSDVLDPCAELCCMTLGPTAVYDLYKALEDWLDED